MTGIEADYLVIGAGAMAMGFVDQLLTDGDSTVVMVDRRHAPGGHWIDGYAFLRLHQPAAYYGVNSRPLDSGARDEQGPNAGLIELASRDQVVGYYDAILNQRFLPSGRVRFFPMTVHEGGGEIVSRLTGERRTVRARRVVDATHLSPSIPAHHTPDFEVAPGAACIRVNDLPALARPGADYVLVGAGKTGMDTALWLLENGVGPARIRWIMPRDSWMLDRAHYQPGQEHLGEVLDTLANEVEAIVESTSLEDLFERLEAKGCRLRLDPSVTPTIHRCATVSKGELALMRTITDVVRMGYVQRIEAGRIVLDGGEIATRADTIHIDCTAPGINYRPTRPIFEDGRVTLQHVRLCQPVFSAALIGHVEVRYGSDEEKNAICPPVEPPSDTVGWLRMLAVELPNRTRLITNPEINAWLATCRLDPLAGRIRNVSPADTHDVMAFARYMQNAPAAIEKVTQLLAAITSSRT
ncbi:MAG: hypothetical protein FD160_1606 [Caulobacteraceae bacterium]|nr:MAG: hypothetical protein FD160_1606 [Caulobacteraceae bacterium]